MSKPRQPQPQATPIKTLVDYKPAPLTKAQLSVALTRVQNKLYAAEHALVDQEAFNNHQRITNRMYAILHGVTLFVVVLISVQVFF